MVLLLHLTFSLLREGGAELVPRLETLKSLVSRQVDRHPRELGLEIAGTRCGAQRSYV